jgi:predicted small secreted protein
MKRFLKITLSVTLMSVLLAGCSGLRVVESDVTAFSAWTSAPPGPDTPYRFERLPSQQVQAAQQDLIEGSAIASLAKVGLVIDPAKARLAVTITANTQLAARTGYGYGAPNVFLGAGNFGSSVGFSFPFGGPFATPYPADLYYLREIRIQMRDLTDQKVVFETTALSDTPWGDGYALLPAIIDAALLGFPQPPPGTRRIKVETTR